MPRFEAKTDFWLEVPLPAVDISFTQGRRLRGWVGARDYYSNAPYTPAEQREWWIYFVQGDDGGPIKIGRTTNLNARVSELGCGYPFGTLRYVGVLCALRDTESELHARFQDLRLAGEWFKPGAELVEYIASLPRGNW
jgi:hypothetical protein